MNHLDYYYYYYYYCSYISSFLIKSHPWAVGQCAIKLIIARKCNCCVNMDCLGKDNWIDNTIYISFLIQLMLLRGTALLAVIVGSSFYGNFRLLPLDKVNDAMETTSLIVASFLFGGMTCFFPEM